MRWMLIAVVMAGCGGGTDSPHTPPSSCSQDQVAACAPTECHVAHFTNILTGEGAAAAVCLSRCAQLECSAGYFCAFDSPSPGYCWRGCATSADCGVSMVCAAIFGSGSACVPSCASQPTICHASARCLASGLCSDWPQPNGSP